MAAPPDPEDEAADERAAASAVEEYRREQTGVLSIARLRCRIPDCVFELDLSKLRSLNISQNTLVVIPDSIGQLVSLQELLLPHSPQLVSISPAIAECRILNRVLATYCPLLRTLPASFSTLFEMSNLCVAEGPLAEPFDRPGYSAIHWPRIMRYFTENAADVLASSTLYERCVWTICWRRAVFDIGTVRRLLPRRIWESCFAVWADDSEGGEWRKVPE